MGTQSENRWILRGDPSPGLPTRRLWVALRAFANGFGCGLIGGLLHCIALALLHPEGLDLVWARVLAVSLAFGFIEMWRVTPSRNSHALVRLPS